MPVLADRAIGPHAVFLKSPVDRGDSFLLLRFAGLHYSNLHSRFKYYAFG